MDSSSSESSSTSRPEGGTAEDGLEGGTDEVEYAPLRADLPF